MCISDWSPEELLGWTGQAFLERNKICHDQNACFHTIVQTYQPARLLPLDALHPSYPI
jgi:hypothetical protein